ncbi:hypothetical protein HY78_05180 [Rhizorhabdus wittichii DC-6]|jgi:hypothetical protein|nr:hypothetical protein HY78_05180 [Rhizorhabdus wittichii DC-6]
MKKPLILALAGALLTGAAMADAAAKGPPEASIPFANHGSIDNWQADGRDALYVQGPGRQWYHARLMAPCQDLPFANAIGFETRGTSDFDRFSTIVVRGQRCPVQSVVKSGAPPKKAHKHG